MLSHEFLETTKSRGGEIKQVFLMRHHKKEVGERLFIHFFYTVFRQRHLADVRGNSLA